MTCVNRKPLDMSSTTRSDGSLFFSFLFFFRKAFICFIHSWYALKKSGNKLAAKDVPAATGLYDLRRQVMGRSRRFVDLDHRNLAKVWPLASKDEQRITEACESSTNI